MRPGHNRALGIAALAVASMLAAAVPAPVSAGGGGGAAPAPVPAPAPGKKEASAEKSPARPVVRPLPRESATPWDYMRAFYVLQDRVAQGDARVLRTQRRMMVFLARLFASLPAETWRRPLNAEALALYLLNGGSPLAGKKVLEKLRKEEARKIKPREEGAEEEKTAEEKASDREGLPLPEGLLEGAMAFAAGRNAAAARWLRKVEDENLSNVLRAQLLLVRASLLAGTSEAAAMPLLDEVRLLRPGSLLEEVALRRAMILAGMTEDVKRFERYAATYLRRFPRSVYVNDFLRRLAWLAVALDVDRKPFIIEKLEPGIARLRKRQQALLYAAIAREALLFGKHALSLHANLKVRKLYPDAPRLALRLRVWLDAAAVISPEPEEPVRDLLAMNLDELPPADRRLAYAAIAMADAIMMEPEPSPKWKKLAARDPEPPELERARALAASVDKLLAGKEEQRP